MKNTSESKKSKLWGALPAAPYVLWMVAFIVIPLGMIVFFALTDSQGQFTLENIARGGEYMSVLLRSIKLAAIATVLCVLIICRGPMPNNPKNLLIRPLFSRMVIHAKVLSKKFIHIGSMTMINRVCF